MLTGVNLPALRLRRTALVIGFVVLWVLAGCRPPRTEQAAITTEREGSLPVATVPESLTPMRDGEVIGYIRAVFGQDDYQDISIDLIEWLDGDEAAEARREDGLCSGSLDECWPPNGFYIRNPDDSLLTVEVPADTTVLMQTLSHNPDGSYNSDEVISFDRFLRILSDEEDAHLRSVPFRITLADHVVTSIREQYVPWDRSGR